MRDTDGFSLVEVTLAIGVIAFALLAIFSLIPVGLNSARAAIDATHTSLILEDVQNRIQSSITGATFNGSAAVTLNLYYDRNAVALPGYADALYRADATIAGAWGANPPPPNVDSNYLRPVSIQIGWPVDASSGAIVGNNAARVTASFYVRRP